ncbi:putative cysteine proteinase [Leptomonas pyrrhocoris]|uniref:Putative cysteine proteinase n=1 Tax=Leptomonas pyrrhocoris TaxID=157538 RepID=A0A0N0DY90_LEPPY|nr:putative cysteine proteinase [Leptomonas pyrrhocoris]KPA83885.1 putative cysteine proteinase [Leptomonas pyrrhocoris]|eukprot:XP_015662324.1 putative cysteine proteinase [Leptomonas pyrrhocoris]
MRSLILVAFLLIVGLFIGAECRLETSNSFDAYIRQYGKRYSAVEYSKRLKIFTERLREIEEFNRDGKHSYRRGLNKLTDWTEDEIGALNGARPMMSRNLRSSVPKHIYNRSSHTLPRRVDYRTSVPPVLTSIKDQGSCGSCWAHSAVEAMESHWAIATGHLHVLSQQQVTACTPNPRHCGGTGGCDGSIEALAYDYVAGAGGIQEEWGYPYTAFYGETGKCEDMRTSRPAKVSSYVELPANDQEALMDAVAFKGPIAVSVDASRWFSYRGGIFDGCDYSVNITQNHAVQLVGYGHDYDSGKDYWIIRNSWGPLWGEEGYIRLLREKTPQCGWAVDAHSGAACDGDPDEVWVCGMCGILSGSTYPVMAAP